MRRALAFAVALLFVLASLSAEAKKKKPAKKHKTPAASSKSKSSKSTDAAPAEESESDEAGSDEKASSKKSADEGESEEKKPAPPAEATGDEEPAAKKPPPRAAKPPKEEESTSGGGAPALQFGVGGKALFRNLSWTDDNGALAPYTLSPGPEIAVWLEAFPAAFATDGFAANIGVFGRFDYGIGAKSTLPNNGGTLTTKYQDFYGGLKVRIPLGTVLPYVAGAYGMQKFHLEPADPTRPNFNYGFIRAGAGARVLFTPSIDLDVGANYLIVLDPGSQAGEVRAIYTRTTAYGFDATLSLGFRLANMIGLRAGVDFRQYGVSLHWRTNDPTIRAGGAADRYIAAWGGVEIMFDGVSGGEAGEAPPAKKAPPKAKAPASDEEPGEDSGRDSGKDSSKDEKPSDVE